MTKEDRIAQMLRNKILSIEDIATACGTSVGYVKVLRSKMKRPDYYAGYRTRKQRVYRANNIG